MNPTIYCFFFLAPCMSVEFLTHSQRMCAFLLPTLKDQVINLLSVGSSHLKALYEPIMYQCH